MRILSRIALTFVACAAVLAGGARALQAQKTLNIPFDRIVGVVGQTPILWSDVLEELSQRRAAGLQVPEDSTAQLALARSILDEMIDVEVMVQRARADTSITVADADLTNTVEQQMKRLRDNFKTESEFTAALKSGGFGTIEEYKRWLTDQARRCAP